MNLADTKILIVDDEANHRLMLRLHLRDAGCTTVEAENGRVALDYLAREYFDAILLDLKMSVMDGFAFLAELRKLGKTTPVVVITAFSNVRTAVEAMKLGATEFLTKPVDPAELLQVVQELLRNPEQEQPSRRSDGYRFDGVYSDAGLGRILGLLEMVAPTDASVLILGESGTGKELVARSIHLNSPRRGGPFLPVNCAALNENLVENELFGHEKGAFTGAVAARAGRFEEADGGTLFLDEIGEMPLAVQAKLLRAIQEKTFTRVGGVKSLKSDVRILTATNRDLSRMVAQGTFREDLFFRLNVFPVELPPLRERSDEIPLLVKHFVDKYAGRFSKVIKGWSEGYMRRLQRYCFPGNIRELENLVERSVILTRGERLEEESLPPLSGGADPGGQTGVDLKENERTLILQALEKSAGNKSQAARLLGISRRALYYKLKDYSIDG